MKLPERAVRIGGMAFDRLYSNIVFFSSLPFANAADTAQAQFDGLTSSLVFVVLAFAGAFFFSRKGVPRFVNSKIVLAIACAMTVAGSFCMAPAAAGLVPTLASGALVGFGSAMLFIAWLDVFSRETVTGSLIEAGIAFALAFIASFAFVLAGDDSFAVAMIVSPVVSFAALAFLQGDAIFGKASFRPLGKEGRHLEYRNFVYIFFFGCIMGMMRNYSAAHIFGEQSIALDAMLSLSGFAVCVVVVVMARFADVSAARFLYRISFVFILMSSILLAFGRENIAIATPLAFVGMQCFTCCLIARAMLSSWALGGSPWRKCLVTFGVLYMGEFAGIASALFLVSRTTVMVCSVVLACCVLVGYVFFFTEADFLLISRKAVSAPGIGNAALAGANSNGDEGLPVESSDNEAAHGAAALVAPPNAAEVQDVCDLGDAAAGCDSAEISQPDSDASRHEASIDEICDAISAEFGLTPRESEILPSVARGRTLSRIQEELFISASTVNTHIRHIYAKCGVANRQELLDFVDDRRLLR